MKPLDQYPFLFPVLEEATALGYDRLQYVKTMTVNGKPTTQIDKRIKAFTNLVLDWLEGSVAIGLGTMQAICLVIHFHHQKQLTQNVKQIEPKLSEALDYFENMMGHTFKLI
jgi:hypothetical protein